MAEGKTCKKWSDHVWRKPEPRGVARSTVFAGVQSEPTICTNCGEVGYRLTPATRPARRRVQ